MLISEVLFVTSVTSAAKAHFPKGLYQHKSVELCWSIAFRAKICHFFD